MGKKIMSLDNLIPSLQQHFGFSDFRAGQGECISQLLDGKSSLAIFPTGSGKSLCYQLTALHLPHLTLVVSPLLALMKDQVDFLRDKGIAAASLDSTLSAAEYQQVVADIKQGQLKILMVSVERFKNERFRQMIQNVPMSMLVVDEAHCISEWGHNFRPDYLKLPMYRTQLKIPTVLLLTATATRKVTQDMVAKFQIAPEHVVKTGFYRNNLNLNVLPVSNADKNQALLNVITQQSGCGIVYVTLQKQAEDVAAFLITQGVHAQAYHAGLGNDLRQSIQQRFMKGTTPIIVATIAFGMGVDKSNIRFVVHYDLPKSIENYSQEIGRAGRDGLPSNCITLANLDGLTTLENFVYGDTPAMWGIQRLLEIIRIDYHSEQWEMQATSTSFDTNIRLLTLKTLLVQLEIIGVLEARYSYFAEYKVKFLTEPTQILAKFTGERADFIRAVLDGCRRKKVWAEVDFEAITQSYATDRARILAALDYLQEKNLIDFEAKGAVDVYGVNLNALNKPALAEELIAYFNDKETKEIARIQQLVRFFELNTCLSYNLAKYFDDLNAPLACGHCSVCQGQAAVLQNYQAAQWPNQNQLKVCLNKFEVALLAKLQERDIVSPVTSTQKVQFLVGLNSPWFGRFKIKQISGFGQCENIRFTEVKQWLLSES